MLRIRSGGFSESRHGGGVRKAPLFPFGIYISFSPTGPRLALGARWSPFLHPYHLPMAGWHPIRRELRRQRFALLHFLAQPQREAELFGVQVAVGIVVRKFPHLRPSPTKQTKGWEKSRTSLQRSVGIWSKDVLHSFIP